MGESYNNKFVNLLSRLSDAMMKSGEPMKARAYKKAEETILAFTTEIRSIDDIKGKPGIGTAIMNKLQEYIDTGKIRVLDEEENKPERIFTDIYGIGPKKAKELVQQGITSIDELQKVQKNVLNDVQRKGLLYYEDILKRIPREEIDQYDKFFEKSFPKEPESHYEIVGSYRRQLETSGDIDVIIGSPNANVFDTFLDNLIKNNIIVTVLSRGKNKCLVIAKIPESNTYRRVDFLYTTPEEYAFSVLYFTGSKGFNAVMRGHALKLGFSLNEHGFTVMDGKSKGESLSRIFLNEKDIFDFLGLEYKDPKERMDGRAVVPIGNTSILSEESQKESQQADKKEKQKRTYKKREPKTKTQKISPILIEEVNELQKKLKEEAKPKKEKCPTGQRKNPKTGNCEPMSEELIKHKQSLRNKKMGVIFDAEGKKVKPLKYTRKKIPSSIDNVSYPNVEREQETIIEKLKELPKKKRTYKKREPKSKTSKTSKTSKNM